MKNPKFYEINEAAGQPADVGTSPTSVQSDSEIEERISAALASGQLLENFASPDPLSEPVLGPLERQNRAKLLVQSPTRLYFYWTIRKDPYKTLRKILGKRTGNYRLYLRLLNLETGRTEMHPAEADGSFWFDTDPGHRYRAEIGFFAPFRPFIRIAFSNTVKTPSLGPSQRSAESAQWRIRAVEFASILNAAGYRRDAINIAAVGEDVAAADRRAAKSLSYILGSNPINYRFSAHELAYALVYLAAGHPLDGLRSKIGATLFAFLQQHADKWSSPDVIRRIKERFSFSENEFDEEASPTFNPGASRINLRGKPRKPPFGWFASPFDENLASPASWISG
ncbi:MAG: hypothetical protein C4325_08435 [Blastocatellia bacterium]